MFTQRTGDHRILNPVQPESGHVHGVAGRWGYDPLIPRRYGEFMAWMQQVDMTQIVRNDLQFRYHPLLKMLGCRYMLTPVEGRMVLADLGRGHHAPYGPVGQWVVEPDRDRAFALLGQPGFDPRRLVVLERDPKPSRGHGVPQPRDGAG